jgi:hypothetical protein
MYFFNLTAWKMAKRTDLQGLILKEFKRVSYFDLEVLIFAKLCEFIS